MGYTTDFYGSFTLDRPLSPDHKAYLVAFNRMRHMSWNTAFIEDWHDPIRKAVKLPVGPNGAFFTGLIKASYANDPRDYKPALINYNVPPSIAPGLWCQWTTNNEGTEIVWDECEKFYEYIAWLEFLIEHFLKPWGYVLNGSVKWYGEDPADVGIICVKKNKVKTAIVLPKKQIKLKRNNSRKKRVRRLRMKMRQLRRKAKRGSK